MNVIEIKPPPPPRCLREDCRGMTVSGDTCQLIYETDDVVEAKRGRYKQVNLQSNERNMLYIIGR